MRRDILFVLAAALWLASCASGGVEPSPDAVAATAATSPPSSPTQLAELRAEVERLRRSHDELERRLARLEGGAAKVPAPESPPARRVAVRAPIGFEAEAAAAAPEPLVPQPRRAEPAAPPTAQPAPATAPAAGVADPVETVLAWAEAWSAQEVDRYLSYYSEQFQPAAGVSRAEWSGQRRERLSVPNYIEVSITDPVVEPQPDGRLAVRFTQSYASDRVRDTVVKILTLEREGDDWKIVGERLAR